MVNNTSQVNLVDVTPGFASTMEAEIANREREKFDAVLSVLQSSPVINQDIILQPGDVISITLWSFSPWQGANSGGTMNQSTGPSPSGLGSYQLDTNGMVSLPYVGTVSLQGLSVPAAQSKLADLYVKAGIVQDPSVIIVPVSIPQGRILVTGAIGAPKAIPWTPAGVTLSDALTDALGNGSEVLAQGDFALKKTALQVDIIRDGKTISLPMGEALEQNVTLRPYDKIVIQKSSNVKVVVLGGGIAKNGVEGFGESPSLAEVLGNASGLDANSANDHAVFVLRLNHEGKKPTLYDFSWNKVDGLIAAQQFPMLNGDLVYVAEAPIIPVERAISILFEVALPAATAAK
ncbi:MAG: polysaccharide biosynthesis/export family protein [Acidocella sp.]|nr:polysaccharide biosynthesis/export family protein [Acidocella sp.]